MYVRMYVRTYTRTSHLQLNQTTAILVKIEGTERAFSCF